MINRSTSKLLKVISLFGGVQGIGIICSIVRAKLIAIWIGPIGVGLFGIFNSAIELISGVTQLNFRQSAVRDVSQSSSARLPRIAAIVRWWARRLGVVGALAMLILSPLLSWVSFHDFSYWSAFASLSAAMLVLAIVAGEQTIQQGSGMLKLLGKRSILGAVAGVAASVPLFYFLRQESIVPSILAASLAMMAVFVIASPIKSEAVSREESISVGKGFLRLGIYLTIGSLATTGVNYIFLSYLNTVSDTFVTGLYQTGYTVIVKYVGLVFTALSMEYYPRISRLIHRPRASSAAISHEASVLLWIVTPMIIIMTFAASLIIEILYDTTFLPAAPLIAIGIGGALFRAASYCLAYVIIARGDGKAYILTEIGSAGIGLALNIIGYNLWGLMGLGVSYVVWYIIYLGMVWSVCRWRYGLHLNHRCILTLLICTILVASSILIKLFFFFT